MCLIHLNLPIHHATIPPDRKTHASKVICVRLSLYKYINIYYTYTYIYKTIYISIKCCQNQLFKTGAKVEVLAFLGGPINLQGFVGLRNHSSTSRLQAGQLAEPHPSASVNLGGHRAAQTPAARSDTASSVKQTPETFPSSVIETSGWLVGWLVG